jgi:hypothetical protein
MSSRGLEEVSMAAVAGGVVGRAVLPASPDDVCPAAGEDAFGVGVALAVGSELAVAGFGPGVAAPAVSGEVAEGVSELLVAAEAEGDGAVAAAGAGRGSDPGEAGQRLGVGEPGAAVADLGEQSSGADRGAAGQGPEADGVGVSVHRSGKDPKMYDLAGRLVDDVDHLSDDRSIWITSDHDGASLD